MHGVQSVGSRFVTLRYHLLTQWIPAFSMNFNSAVDVSVEREETWAACEDPATLSDRQPAVRSIERRSGVPGQPSAVTALAVGDGDRRVTTRQAVTERRPPGFRDGFHVTQGEE